MNSGKVKYILSVGVILIGTIINLNFSMNIHQLLTDHITVIRWFELKDCIESMKVYQEHRLLFLCFEGFVILSGIYLIFAFNRPYQSDLKQITPMISTPVSAGQKQFGSARWLLEKEKLQAFNSVTIKHHNTAIRLLLQEGKEDFEECEKAYQEKEFEEDIICSETGNEVLPEKLHEAEYSSNKEHTNIQKGGIVLGQLKEGQHEKIYYVEDDIHTLCIGATRSGKTRTIVLQSIGLLGLANESMIISDPKGELYQYTFPYLKRLGYEVICIDFKNPLKSDRYNFLQPIIDAVDADNIPKAVEATWDLTSQLVGEATGERIWRDGEASIIASSIMSVVYDNKEGANRKYQNMTNVYFFISEMCKVVNNKMPILEYVKKLKPSHPARALLAISEVAPSKTRGSFYTAALTTLRLFTNPLINAMTNKSDYHPMDIGKKKMALFIILPDEKVTYYSLASVLVAQHYELLVKAADDRGGRLMNRVNFLCDEFGNFTEIPDFGTKLTVGGGRGIRFNLFLQSFAQLDEKYGKDVAKTIKGNCENWMYLQTDDIETLEEISKKLGNYTVSTYSLSSNHAKFTTPSSSHSINLTSRALLSIDEIRLISRPYTLVTSRSHPAIMFAPDLSSWVFNQLFGLGDIEHNRRIRELRERRRIQKVKHVNDMDLWNIWTYYAAICEEPAFQRPSAYGVEPRQMKEQFLYDQKGGHNDNELSKK